MNAIREFVYGESIRRSLEGATSQDIIEIAEGPEPGPTTSPFAKVLGAHLYSESSEVGQKKKKRKAGKKRRRG
jgi:hypothetical protein